MYCAIVWRQAINNDWLANLRHSHDQFCRYPGKVVTYACSTCVRSSWPRRPSDAQVGLAEAWDKPDAPVSGSLVYTDTEPETESLLYTGFSSATFCALTFEKMCSTATIAITPSPSSHLDNEPVGCDAARG